MGEPLSAVKRALYAIEQLQGRIDQLEARAQQPIAIVGLGCRFPGAASPDDFWSLLKDGRSVIGRVPADRWNASALFDADADVAGKAYSVDGGFLDSVDGFDAAFFGIAPREAATLDPQQRLLLEVVWEALEHGGIAPDRLRGTRTAVFAGISGFDHAAMLSHADDAIDAYYLTGNSLGVGAGRVSYVLGLSGPSMAVDTACSSSLVAVHLASQSLRSGEADLAIAGGVNLILTPTSTLGACRAHMLSPTGRCSTFDAAANGYVRGEGAGVVILERLDDALANGRRILAVIRGTAVNHTGEASGLTVPRGEAQQSLIRDALRHATLRPAQIGYVEAHGTGTTLGDPIEIEALGAVLAEGRDTGSPCRIGSVKSSIGHLEAAAGIAGLIKVVLAIRERTLPPQAAFETPTPRVAWSSLPLTVQRRLEPWESSEPLRAGVSSFGFSGTNAHVIVEEAPGETARVSVKSTVPILLSAATEPALLMLAAQMAERVRSLNDRESLADLAWTAATGRAQLAVRIAFAAGDAADAASRLDDIARGAGALRPVRSKPRLDGFDGTIEECCKQWMDGAAIEWTRFFDGAQRIIDLPTYPFERRLFPRLSNPNATTEADAWQVDLTPQALRAWADHRLRGRPIMPASGYLELASAIAARTWGGGHHRLEQISFRNPLRLDDERLRVRMNVARQGERTLAIIAESQAPGAPWITHASLTAVRNVVP